MSVTQKNVDQLEESKCDEYYANKVYHKYAYICILIFNAIITEPSWHDWGRHALQLTYYIRLIILMFSCVKTSCIAQKRCSYDIEPRLERTESWEPKFTSRANLTFIRPRRVCIFGSKSIQLHCSLASPIGRITLVTFLNRRAINHYRLAVMPKNKIPERQATTLDRGL